jgi:hypothetical protein
LDAGAFTLHVASAVMHGINGVLVCRVGAILGFGRAAALLAGLLFVCYPTAVEAVAWPSAFSDVLVVSSTLGALIAACRIQSTPVSLTVVCGLTMTALLAKESATALPLLYSVAYLAVRRPSQRRRLSQSALLAAVLVVAYFGGRALMGRWPPHPGITLAGVSAVVGQPFLVLAWPFHVDIRTPYQLERLAWAAASAALVALAFLRWKDGHVVRAGGLAGLWVVSAVAPIVGVFAIGSNLEGSRYIYTATVPVALLMAATVAAAQHDRARRAAVCACLVLIITAATTTWRHQQPWLDAAAIRDAILPVIADLPLECDRVFVTALPDTVNGAHVARNGVPQALLMLYGRRMEFVHTPAETSPPCRLDFAAFAR